MSRIDYDESLRLLRMVFAHDFDGSEARWIELATSPDNAHTLHAAFIAACMAASVLGGPTGLGVATASLFSESGADAALDKVAAVLDGHAHRHLRAVKALVRAGRSA